MCAHPVDLWRFDIAAGENEPFRRLISADEAARADRFLEPTRGLRYISACAQVRQILSTYLEQAPEDLVFKRNAFGKPELSQPVVNFNVSRSGNLGVLAVSYGAVVGVDIEQIRPFDWEPLAQREFSRSEYDGLAVVDAVERLDAFFRCWTMKEAVVKAIGEGLSIPLESFAVTVDNPLAPRMLEFRDHSMALLPWTLSHFDVADGFAGSVAAPVGAPLELIQRTWGSGVRSAKSVLGV